MLCLLEFTKECPKSDLLLVSAMVKNGNELAAWLQTITSGKCQSFSDQWKPTRQARGCVVYNSDETDYLNSRLSSTYNSTKPSSVPKEIKKSMHAHPHALFSLRPGWHPGLRETRLISRITGSNITLGVGSNTRGRWLTANRNEVASAIAIAGVKKGLKVLVFAESVTSTCSIMKKIIESFPKVKHELSDRQIAWRRQAIFEAGSESAIYDCSCGYAAVHHGELLPEERMLIETVYQDKSSELKVLAATSTLAQGLNLPCQLVLLAGTDRIDDKADEDDPEQQKKFRFVLPSHEILNALGRAGRAGLSATGLAIVIPGDIITFSPAGSRVAENSILDTIFSDHDQCLIINDPIELLKDYIEVHGERSEEAEYLFRRVVHLAHPMADENTKLEGTLRRSLSYFRRFSNSGNDSAEEWVTGLCKTVRDAAEVSDVRAKLDWIDLLAGRMGVGRGFLDSLATSIDGAIGQLGNSSFAWMEFALNILINHNEDFDAILRPWNLTKIFGRGYSNVDGSSRRLVAKDGILIALRSWLSGAPMTVIERNIVSFINLNEGNVKRPTSCDSKVKRARRFIIRLIPDLAYLAGCLTQVARGPQLAQDEFGVIALPLVVEVLSASVRRGFDNPYMLAFAAVISDNEKEYEMGRVSIHQDYFKVAVHLRTTGKFSSWSVAKEQMKDAVAVAKTLDT